MPVCVRYRVIEEIIKTSRDISICDRWNPSPPHVLNHSPWRHLDAKVDTSATPTPPAALWDTGDTDVQGES